MPIGVYIWGYSGRVGSIFLPTRTSHILSNRTPTQTIQFFAGLDGFIFKEIAMKNQVIRFFSVILLIAVAVVYGGFLWNPILFDDVYFFGVGARTLETFVSSFRPLEIRWLPYATIAWTGKYFGLELINFRIEALLLHGVVGIAMFHFLAKLYKLVFVVPVKQDVMPLYWIAFFSALIFVWHPVAVYAAGYLIQRTIVMATLFGLLAMNAYIQGITTNSRRWLGVSVVLYLLAVLCKEHVIMLPAVILALTVLLSGLIKAPRKTLCWVFAAYFAIALFVIGQKIGLYGKVYEIAAPEMLGELNVANPHAMSSVTQSGLFFKYLGLWLLPNPAWMSADMREPFATNIFSPYLLALLAYLGYGVIAAWLLFQRGRKGLLGLALLFPWLLFFTEFTTVRIQESFVLYRSYLWMPGIFIAMPLLIEQLKSRSAIILLLMISVIFAIFSVDRLKTFSHPLLLWDDAESLVQNKHNLPGVDRIYNNRGTALTNTKLYREAIADFTVAIHLQPNNSYYHMGLGAALYNVDDYTAAIVEYSKSVDLDNKNARAYYFRALSYEKSGLVKLAKSDFKISCQLGWESGCKKM